jgi:arabinofuranosyltransferase
VSIGASLSQGLAYFRRTLLADPVTLPVISLGWVAFLPVQKQDWPLVVGIPLTAAYVLWIGGDFMMGRFFAAPFVWSLCVLARSARLSDRKTGLAVAATLLTLGLCAQWEPALLSGYGFSRANNLVHGDRGLEPRDRFAYQMVDGIADERRFYHGISGLFAKRQTLFEHPQVTQGLALRRSGDRVIAATFVGWLGYFAGPRVHIVDRLALTDPLLARLPAMPGSRIGHFERKVPDGYIETIATGANRLTDADLAIYFDHLHLVTSGPIWSVKRFTTIGALLAGRYRDHVARYASRSAPDGSS